MRKLITNPLILAVAFVILLFGGGFFLYTLVQPTTPVDAEPTSFDSEKVDRNQRELSSLHETYTYDTDGFEVSFPRDWDDAQLGERDDSVKYQYQSRIDNHLVFISVHPLNEEELHSRRRSISEGDHVFVNGAEAFRYSYGENYIGPGFVQFFIFTNGKRYQVTFTGDQIMDSTEQQILDSLRFFRG